MLDSVFADDEAVIAPVDAAPRRVDCPAYRNALLYSNRRVAVGEQGLVDYLHIIADNGHKRASFPC